MKSCCVLCRVLVAVLLVATVVTAFSVFVFADSFPGVGKTFSAGNLNQLPLIDKPIATFEAEVWIDPSKDIRYGIIVGNYTDASGSYNEINFEIVKGGFPKYFNEKYGNVTFTTDLRGYTAGGSFVKVAIVIENNGVNNKALLYVNGELKETVTKNDKGAELKLTVLTPSVDRNAGTEIVGEPLALGGDYRGGNTQYFKGEIKNLAMYSDARTAAELKASASMPFSVDKTDTQLVAAYDLTSDDWRKDLSANGNDIGKYIDGGISFGADKELMSMSKGLSDVPRTFAARIFLPEQITDRGGVILGNYGTSSVHSSNRISFEIYSNGAPRLFFLSEEGANESIVFDADVRIGGWVHLAIVHDGEKLICYLDGKEAGTAIVAPDLASTLTVNNPLCLGGDWRSNNDAYFKGQIRDVAVYSDARSAAEIISIYENGVDVDENDLLCYYDCDTASGGVIRDLSQNGYDISTIWLDESVFDLEDYEYTFAVVGDTQKQAYKDWQTSIDADAYNDTAYMAQIYDWIVSNKDEQNIELVIGLGDITEKNDEKEWKIAYENITKLEKAGIPYHIIMGNHDKTAQLDSYFKNEGNFKNADIGYYSGRSLGNYYMRFTIGGIKYMIVGIEYGANDQILDWVGKVADENPDYRVIVTTHAYMFRDGTTLDKGDVVPPNSTGITTSSTSKNNGDMMYEKLMSKHRNILMVLSGHDPYENIAFRQDRGENGNLVSQFLIDPQGMDVSLGMVALFHFSADGRKIAVEWYSTGEGKYYRLGNQFEFELYDNVGNGIHSLEKVSSEDGVDTYHVYYTNGTYEEFVVTNGKDGADGINGADGLNGTDGKDGADGNDGADGKDGGITIAIAALACGACSVVSVALLFVVIKKKRMI